MAEPAVVVEAVVLRAVPYGDTDLVVHVFTRERGKLGAFARGARRSQRRFGGGLEPFGLFSLELSFRKGRDLVDLKSATLVEPNAGIRDDLGRLAHAGYGTELVRELTREAEPNVRLFDVLVELFRRLSKEPAKSLVLRAFELEVLAAAGLAPELSACVRCGRAVESGGRFDVEEGGVACATCWGPGALAVDVATLRLLRVLKSGGLAAGAADEAHLPVEPARRVLKAFIDRHVHHDLKSLAFLRDVGAPP